MIDQALAPIGDGLARGLAIVLLVVIGAALLGTSIILYIAYRIAGWKGILAAITILTAAYGIRQYSLLYKECMTIPNPNRIDAYGCQTLTTRCAKIGAPATRCARGPTLR